MKGTKTSVADDAAMLQMQQVSFSPPLLIHYLRILNSTFFIRTLKKTLYLLFSYSHNARLLMLLYTIYIVYSYLIFSIYTFFSVIFQC